MVYAEEPPSRWGAKRIIIFIVTLSLLIPGVVYEAFDNCCSAPANNGWDYEQQKALLLIVSKQFAPPIKKAVVRGYGNGNCVPYAREKTGIMLYGWAATFISQAEEKGYVVSDMPIQGGMLITGEAGGHVAVIEKVEDGMITVSEQNYHGLYIVSTRQIPADSPVIRGYIYK